MSEAIDWTQVDWKDLYPRLVYLAAKKLNRLSWRGRPSGPIPGGTTAKDIVHNAIVKTMSGQRIWNRDLSLFDHLAGVISSDISQLVSSAENRRTLQADEKIVNIADHMEDPETIAIRKSQEQRFFAYLEEKKPALRQLAETILYSQVTGTELAVQLNLSIREVDSLKRALRRATEDFLNGEEPSNGANPAVKKMGESYGS
jgi:hypothetical protein